ncbi:putative F-box/kelch-repeat protein [Cardamine amara subsp. amara]|uniref:F-box/kelch-repeat protein n=1 Tax=Cardamine amara subsp. amara TaxID=228776 RepID=A0ABD0Z2Z3_CARAN
MHVGLARTRGYALVEGGQGFGGSPRESLSFHFDQLFLNILNKTKRTQELAVLFPGARLINSGDNILLFWDHMVGNIQQIWCAQISLEKRGEIWGNIDWSHPVMTVDADVDPFLYRHKFLHCVSVTL